MTVVYANTTKNARMEATRNEVANGTLEIRTAANAVLVTYGLDATAGSVSGNTWTLGFDASTVAATGTGTAANAVVKDSGGNIEITLSVTASGGGGDITIDNTSITSAQDITVVSAAITHAA